MGLGQLEAMLRHNAWANHTVMAACVAAPAVAEAVAYDGRPLAGRLNHWHGVERAFLDVLRGAPARPDPPRDPAALLAYADATAAGFTAAIAGVAHDATFNVPWWERDFTVAEIVSQVLTHSAQHRSEIAWELARTGVDTGELDYIVWAAGGEPAPGEAPREG
jgi:uncharacterized damage-inducible protein DinB